MRRTLAALVVSVLAACGGSSPKTTTPKEEPVVGPPQVAWKDMSVEQKGRYMDKVVTPRMKELFVAFDAKEFAEFGCKTCHGEEALKTKKFEMPNPGLFQLPASQEGFAELAKEKPEYMKFMATQVKPEMAKLLGIEEFDPANPKEGTFGCMGCHGFEKPGA